VVNDTLPLSLTEFGDQLERAIDLELETRSQEPAPRRRPPRRRRAVLSAIAGCVIAAVTAAVILLTSAGSDRAAWSQHILRAAAFALPAPNPHTIIHVSVTQTMTPSAQRGSGNPAAQLTAEGWFQQGGARRSVTEQTEPGRGTIWQAGGRLYDTATHRVYLPPALPNGHPHYTLSKQVDGSYTLRVDGPDGLIEQTTTAAEADALRSGTDQISWAETWNGHRARLQPLIGPSSKSIRADETQQPDQVSLTFSAQLHRLLQSGRAQVTGHSTIDGRAAIKIALPGTDGPWMVYYVDPDTYRPIEFDLYGAGKLTNRTRVIFHAYNRLPLEGNTKLLRLPVPPGTPVEHNPTQYFQRTPPPLFIW
jgi:hypothetical protein